MEWDWGNVPTDDDLLPFSKVLSRNGDGKPPRKHHYVPVAYLNGFCDADGRLWSYRLADPTDPHPSQPRAIAYRKDYYSQLKPDGAQDHKLIEDLWHKVETVWPKTLEVLKAGRLSPAASFNALGLASVLRARVPAARERHELLVKARMRAEFLTLERIGQLPEEYRVYEGELDTVPIGVNPQQSIRTMFDDIREFGDLCFEIGFELVRNTTDTPFITSDNPVCIYDPDVPFHKRKPYPFGREVEVLLPLDPWTMLRGRPRLGGVNRIVGERKLRERADVRRVNRTIAQFAYDFVFAVDRSSDGLVRDQARRVPTVTTEIRWKDKEVQIVWENVFGSRPELSVYVDSEEKAARVQAVIDADRAARAAAVDRDAS